MLHLRKDLKIGIALGFALVAVLGVYFLLSALTSTNSNSGNNQVATIQPKTPASDEGKVGAKSESGNPLVIPTPNSTAQQNNSIVAKPEIVISSQTPGDPWEKAFNTGKIEPATTITPDPRATRIVNNAADSQVIRGINEQTQNVPTSVIPSGNSTVPPTGSINSTPDRPELTPPAGVSQAGAAQSHLVENGDTLTSIAAQYYGDGRKFKLIVDANPGLNPNRLRLGAKLVIPAEAARQAVINDAPAVDPMTLPTFDANKQYRVQVGDSLHKIAFNLYGTSSAWTKIYEANKQLIGPDPAKVKVGSVLVLPEPPTKRA